MIELTLAEYNDLVNRASRADSIQDLFDRLCKLGEELGFGFNVWQGCRGNAAHTTRATTIPIKYGDDPQVFEDSNPDSPPSSRLHTVLEKATAWAEELKVRRQDEARAEKASQVERAINIAVESARDHIPSNRFTTSDDPYAELKKIRSVAQDILLNGADESIWPPGTHYADALASYVSGLHDRIERDERERGLLMEACQASIELVAAAIMRGMPITPRVAKVRNLLVTAIAEATGEGEGK